MFLDAYYHSLNDKKGLGVYLRVTGNDQQKTDFGRFEYHPTLTPLDRTRQ